MEQGMAVPHGPVTASAAHVVSMEAVNVAELVYVKVAAEPQRSTCQSQVADQQQQPKVGWSAEAGKEKLSTWRLNKQGLSR